MSRQQCDEKSKLEPSTGIKKKIQLILTILTM